MRRAIWVLYWHKTSTDQYPKHGLCPQGADSWCKYQQSIVTKRPYKHKNSIPIPIIEFKRPVFRSVSEIALLEDGFMGIHKTPTRV